MKLLRIGDLILNMDQVEVIVVEDDAVHVFFAGGVPDGSRHQLTIREDGKKHFLAWLNRQGVHDLSAEHPEWQVLPSASVKSTYSWPDAEVSRNAEVLYFRRR